MFHVPTSNTTLASCALNKEANRVIWRFVAVVPCNGHIEAFADALMQDPLRAAHTSGLCPTTILIIL